MWKQYVIFVLFVQAFSFDLPRKCISDLRINNNHYNVSEVYRVGDINSYPADAVYDHEGNLFYVKTTQDGQGYHYDVYVVKRNSGNPEKVKGLPEGLCYSIAIDKKLSQVYFGTGKGIYVYNYESHTAVPLINDDNMKLDSLVIDTNSNKYLIENDDGVDKIYLLDGNKKVHFHTLEALNEMAIDDKNDIYYIKDDKLYVLKASQWIPREVADVNYTGVAQITFYGHYVFIVNNQRLEYFNANEPDHFKQVNTPFNVTTIAFESNGDFALGVKGNILKYKKNECYIRPRNRVVDEYGA